jgi:hypothetical protein
VMAMRSAKRIRRMPFVSMRSKCRQLPKQMLLSSLLHGGMAFGWIDSTTALGEVVRNP